MAHKVACWHLRMLLFYFLVTACHLFAASHGATDAEILVNFKNSLSTNSLLHDWNVSGIPPCTGGSDNWVGLRCNDDGTIDKLLLENMGLNGTIDMDILMQLPKLRTLSFMNNSFEGPMSEVKKLASLRNLYLSNNSFSGKIDKDAFDGMSSLREVYLAHNEFTGEIPRSLVLVRKLTKLSLEGNQFGGNLPDFPQENLGVFNAAGNNFKGQIPTSLADFSPGSFAGNQGLCGKPLPACKSSRKKTIVIIAVVVVAVVALSAIVVFACIRFGDGKKEAQSSDPFGDGKMGDIGQLHFVRHDRDRFDLQDLLRASAEVLGSGIFGSSYKAVLLDGPAMVVKRFRHMSSVGKDEFHEHMRKLGALSHPNLLPLVAYYYRKEDKLLVSDFIENGSLASRLHGKRSPGKPWIDWPTRLRIVKGVAKGLAYLYKEFPTLALPHGHLKSSNVLLDDTFDPLLTDYALVPVVNKDHSQRFMVAYKSPECSRSDRPNRKTDVWSLVVREEWTLEVFDMDMMRTKNCEGEMLKLLKIGMCCCEWNLERRWDLKEAVARIEELKERDNDDWSNSCASAGEVSSSRAVTDDDFPFSVNS
ncbi:hypothetical protein DKX38_027570 [Salix brachista]|uniref:Protein kinase domain-containing protein n=1 Tax=Salix brachista TaxID=2182728 RepID=A0A5N5J7I6_9ROSI|nr:hypothetical protein DKX38_027570 [Salix brachista]